MARKYDALRVRLSAAAAEGKQEVKLTFAEIEEILGAALPDSAGSRTFWANNSHVQAQAWRAAGWHVESAYPDRGHVTFKRGAVGGTYAARKEAARRRQH